MSQPGAAEDAARERDLRALREDLQELLASSREGARPVELDQPIGRLSRVDAMQQQSMLAANRAAAQRRLQQVDAALRRLADGEFGFCLACGEQIPAARLQARPEAPFCITCQSERERRER